jgi:hypothetical protein
MSTQPLSKTRQLWLNHIRQCEAESLTVSEYCKKHNLPKQRFYHYKSELKKLGIPFSDEAPISPFVAVKAIDPKRESKNQNADVRPVLSFSLIFKSRLMHLQICFGPLS